VQGVSVLESPGSRDGLTVQQNACQIAQRLDKVTRPCRSDHQMILNYARFSDNNLVCLTSAHRDLAFRWQGKSLTGAIGADENQCALQTRASDD